MNILEKIAEHTKIRVEKAKEDISLEKMMELAHKKEKGDLPFEKALKSTGLSFICECKKASPSKGIIAEDFPYLNIAKDYEEAGADCISVLTEPEWFLGKNEYAREIVKNVKIPVIRKDFTVDPYRIYEAKNLGASAVLLIVSILSKEKLEDYLRICGELGLSALVETHDEKEIDIALSAGAGIIGVNNRNLKDFSVDSSLAGRMRKMIPEDKVFVSESGIKSEEDILRVRDSGADAVLIGEMLMKADDRKATLKHLKEITA